MLDRSTFVHGSQAKAPVTVEPGKTDLTDSPPSAPHLITGVLTAVWSYPDKELERGIFTLCLIKAGYS